MKNNLVKVFPIIFLAFTIMINGQTKYSSINKNIDNGNYKEARRQIDSLIKNKELSSQEIYNLNLQKDIMNRIKLDFNKTKEDILPGIKKYYPDVDEVMLKKWEKDKSLEMKIINGKKMYFHSAVANLFRINKSAKARKEEVEGKTESNLDSFLKKDLPEILKKSKTSGKELVNPVKIKLNYTLTVDKNAVPDGEIIRCWLPYPREGHGRQQNIKLLSVNSDEYIIADNKNPQRTLYLEKTAHKDVPTKFNMQLEYTAYAEYDNLKAEDIKPYNTSSKIYKENTAERAPHIVFTDEIKNLSRKIIGDEQNPYNQVKLIFKWISDNIPWASAREYSTISNISNYCLNNLHGDCGIKGLLFITLCRYNGIPAKWQSGWMLHPGSVNLHDWTEIYFEGKGWIPVDPYMGVRESDDPEIQYFFTDGIDAYHFIVNDDFGKPLFPAKIYPRSETNDFQRGEVEWKAGNIYFDKWNYHMDVEYLPAR